MKERVLASALCLGMVLSVLLSGCGVASSSARKDSCKTQNTVIDNRSNNSMDEAKGPAVIEVSDKDFDVKDYLFENDFCSMYFVVVTNNSKAVVSISGNGIAKDANGSAIGAGDMTIDVLGPGETSLGYFYFNDVKGIASVDYSLSYDTNTRYTPVIATLETEQTLNNTNVTIKATNNGTTCAEFVEAHALFFDANNTVIRHTSTYLTDNDSEIKPGKSVTAQLDSFENYDHVEVYLTGRSTGKTVSTSATNVSDDDFVIVDHLYTDSYSTMYFLVVTSNASVPVSIMGNATAMDSNGNILGAGDMHIDILGPGETSIGYFYFNGVQGVKDVEYQLDYDTDPHYTPVISYLTTEQTVNNNNVIVAVTNDNSVPAQFVEAHALFFDAQNNVIRHMSNYVSDDDSEIKPGKTLVEQLDAFGTFDHVEVYFTGRAEGGPTTTRPAQKNGIQSSETTINSEEPKTVPPEDTTVSVTQPTVAPATEPATAPSTEPAEQLVNGMHLEFKEAMDTYEEFMDEYIEFMTKYAESDNPLTMALDYAKFIGKFADATAKFEKWEDSDLNNAEMQYYIQVQTRVNQKLLTVAAAMPG